MRLLKDIINENLRGNEMIKPVQLLLKCTTKKIGSINYDDETDNFEFNITFNLSLYESKTNKIANLECFIFGLFDINDSKMHLNDRTYIDFDGDNMFGFNSEEIASIVMNAIDNETRIWEKLNKELGIIGIKDSHKLFYDDAIYIELRKEIKSAYEDFIS